MATPQMQDRIPRWTLGDRLRKARTLTGLNTREFAELIGVSQPTVTSAENDKAKVRKITLNAWSMATGVPVDWLLEGGESGEDDPDGDGPPDGGDSGTTPTPPTALDELAKRKRGRKQTTDREFEDYYAEPVAA